jgi:hypothetical protein
MGAATVASLLPGSRAHAEVISANPRAHVAVEQCSSSVHENIEGYDAGQPEPNGASSGNRALIFINGSGVISSLHDFIARSLFVLNNTDPLDNNAEVGWGVGGAGPSSPEAYAEWVNRGVNSDAQFYPGYTLTPGNNTVFTVVNTGGIGIFRFYVDSQSSPFYYSATLNFNSGWIATNSERYNNCDSVFTQMSGLNYYSLVSSTWFSNYLDLECYNTSAPGWYFDKISNSEEQVNDHTGVTCPSGPTVTKASVPHNP